MKPVVVNLLFTSMNLCNSPYVTWAAAMLHRTDLVMSLRLW